MQYLTKKKFIKFDSVWKRTFLAEHKRKTGKYSDGSSDWVTLAWQKNEVWWGENARVRYEAQAVPVESFLRTDIWSAKLFDEKPTIDELWEMVGDAVYLACFTPELAWTFVITHEDHPTRFIYSEKLRDADFGSDFTSGPWLP